MNFFQKKYTVSTYAKYFFSYLLIFSMLIMGFFLIVRNQLMEIYFTQRCVQAEIQLDNMGEQLNDEFLYLLQVDNSLSSNVDLLTERYRTSASERLTIYRKLYEYTSTTRLISSIIYMQKKNDLLVSTKLAVTYEDGIFHITNSMLKSISFDPTPYFDAYAGQLVFIANEEVQYLLYFPSMSANASYISFYILDVNYLYQLIKGLTTEEMPAVALIDADRRIVTGTNPSLLMPYLDSIGAEDGTYQVDSSISLCVHSGIGNGFSMVSLLSNDFLNAHINKAFANSYVLILILAVVCFFLILLAMRITYVPLYRLTQKLVPNLNSRQSFLKQLEYTFSDIGKQNQDLKDKLENYRISMQKSLLDSILVSQHTDMTMALPNIDQFFDMDLDKEIFIIRISAPAGTLPWADIQESLSDVLPGNDACILLESEGRNALFLINYIGAEQDKRGVLKKILHSYHEEKGFLSAISNGSGSPMDIPALYENVMYASSYWPQTPVAEFDALSPASAAYAYPYDALNLLSKSLTKNDFFAARQVISDIFHITNLHIEAESNLPSFFVHCVLIDTLSVIVNYMNLSHLKFQDYSDLYFETLYFCRSYPYKEKARGIQANIEKLILFCEQEISQKLITSAPFTQMLEECYCQPDFSISVLANRFHVSVAYMSQLFKKEMNVNFSDYLWGLRLKKARELLCTTDLSIDEISIAVGYYNTSSFRRKFKQETGLSPSQFRTDFQRLEPPKA